MNIWLETWMDRELSACLHQPTDTCSPGLDRDEELILNNTFVEIPQEKTEITIFSVRLFHPLFCKQQVC